MGATHLLFHNQGRGRPIGGGDGEVAYADKVLATESANLIAYWPLWEASGATADNFEGTAARDGTYTGVTLGQTGIGDGKTCPLFDGSTDWLNVYSASFASAFSGATGTFMAWAKVSAAGVWTDGAAREVVRFLVDGNNYFYIRKQAANNELYFIFRAGGTTDDHTFTVTTTDWIQIVMKWDKPTANRVYYYWNTNTTSDPGIGTWVGTPASNSTVIGSASGVPGEPWSGWLAHCAVWTKVLSDAQIADLYAV